MNLKHHYISFQSVILKLYINNKGFRGTKMITILGYMAAVFTTLSFLPQAIKVIKTKNTSGISLSMYFMFTIGVLLWCIYGIVTEQTSIA